MQPIRALDAWISAPLCSAKNECLHVEPVRDQADHPIARRAVHAPAAAVGAIKGSRPTVASQGGRTSLRVFAGNSHTSVDEQARVEEAVRSFRTLRRKNLRSICKKRSITPEDEVGGG